MLNYQFRPIDRWPGEVTKRRRRSQFKATYTSTLDLLERELRHLEARGIVVQADLTFADLRNDGMLRAGASPRTPGIILSFESKHGPLSYPCDQYDDWTDNLRAIALALEALRAVDRYGVTRRAEQYRGWQALPAPAIAAMTREQAAQFLAHFLGQPGLWKNYLAFDREAIGRVLREAEMRSHPDRLGNADQFKLVQEARRLLLA